MTGTGRVSFSGHETFPFRYTWLKKAVDAVGGDEYAFHADDAMVKFGVGKNMVSSMRHWGLATGMLEEGAARRGSRVKPFRATELGALLFRDEGWDPYLEDPGTLWLPAVAADALVLATGYDCPAIRHVILATQIRSPIMFEQIVGRASRGPLVGGHAKSTVWQFDDHLAAHGLPQSYYRYSDYDWRDL